MEHPIQGLMQTAMENLTSMIDVNTIVGDPIETPDGSVIMTVSRLGFGFAAGGSEFNTDSAPKDQGLPFGGGSGGGVSITPIAFLIVNSSGVKLVHLDEKTSLIERLIEFAPQGIDKIQSMFNQKSNNKQQNSESPNIQPHYKPKERSDSQGEASDILP